MKLIQTPSPEPGTWRYRFCAWFVNHVNFCHGTYYGTDVEKPDNKVFNFFYTYWLFPFVQNECICCNTVRGLIYGGVLGFIIGRIW